MTKYGIFVCEGPCRINFGCQNSQTNHFCMGDNSKFLFSNIVFHTVATQKKILWLLGPLCIFYNQKGLFLTDLICLLSCAISRGEGHSMFLKLWEEGTPY